MPIERSPYVLPVAIIAAGLLLSVALYSVRTSTGAPVNTGDVSNILPVQESDHILGSPDAPVMVIEYADLDCEYCKRTHEVMEQLIAEYGPSGKVAWTYRHFPLIDQHPDAGSHAQAAECVADIGSPALFWRFVTALFAQAPGAARFDPEGYGAVAESLNVSAAALSECLTANRFASRVARDFENALAIGATTAPHLVVLIEGAEPMTVSGYFPYDQMKQVIDTALQKHEDAKAHVPSL